MRRFILVALLAVAAACNEIQPNTPIQINQPTAPSLTPTTVSLVATPAELPVGGGTAFISVETTAGGLVAANVPIALEVTGGSLDRTSVTTDRTGHAALSWSGTQNATLTADAGGVIGTLNLRVAAPPPPLPPDRIPPPPPTNTPPPVPPPPPLILPVVSLRASASTVIAGDPLTFTAQVSELFPGESVTMYRWDADNDGDFEATTTVPTRELDAFTTHGPQTVAVTIETSQGRTATGRTRVIVTSP
jgi:hypothetical protein